MEKHRSVLLKETIEALNLKSDHIIVDCTLGYGGHSKNILDRIRKGFLFAFDQDSEAIRHSTNRLSAVGTNFTIIEKNFVHLKEELEKRNVKEVDGFLFDLGVSSPQLANAERGFSFHEDAPLDMRMNQKQELSAYNVVNDYKEEDLVNIFYKYGEDKFSKNIARKIVEYRKNKKIETTLELVEIIKSAVPIKARLEKHPARQIFQAIRIEVNHELDVIPIALEDACSMLKVGGRICVITFHSLEDRLVKNFFKEKCKVDDLTRGLPGVDASLLPDFKIVERIKPSKEEIEENPRSRSAILRVIEKVK